MTIRDPRPNPYAARPISRRRDVITTGAILAILATLIAGFVFGGGRTANAITPEGCAAFLAYDDRTEADRVWLTQCEHATRPYSGPTGTPTATPSAEPTATPTGSTPGPITTTTTTPPTTPTPTPALGQSYITVGRELRDPNGDRVVVRGYEQNYSNEGWLPEYTATEIGKTGANTFRMLPHFLMGNGRYSLAQIEAVIQRGIAAHMLVDVAIDGGRGTDPAAVYLRADVKALLFKYQRNIVIHAKGEATEATGAAWVTNAKAVVAAMRAAGYITPLYIMGNTYGRNLPTILQYGQQVVDADPLHRIVFGWQAYWGSGNGYQNQYSCPDAPCTFTKAMAAIAAAPFPIQVGLIYRSDPQAGSNQTVDYSLLMRLAQELGIGWLWWDWRQGIDNATTDGYYGHWATIQGCTGSPCVNGHPIGRNVAIDDPNSISRTSVRSSFMLAA